VIITDGAEGLVGKVKWPRQSVWIAGAIGSQTARKPNFVLDDHSSRRCITASLQQPTRRFWLLFQACALTSLSAWAHRADTHIARWRVRTSSLPIWSCSVWGLPCRTAYAVRGALLPHLFTLTFCRLRGKRRFALCCTGRPDGLNHPSRTLSGTLPCGVRTFLPRRTPCGEDGSDHPAACINSVSQQG